MKFHFPCNFHFTTVLCVDDDIELVRWLKLILEKENRICFFHGAQRALDFILEKQEAAKRRGRLFLLESLAPYEAIRMIPKLHEKFYHLDRMEDLSVLVIDYYMPGMDGLTLCEALVDTPYQKLMLTGEADQSMAISAFNQQIINQFILKSQSDLVAEIAKLVKKMQWHYFTEQSEFFIKSLIEFDRERFSYFTDVGLSAALQDLFQERGIREWCLFNDQSEFMLIDHHHHIFWLSIQTDKTHDALIQEAEEHYLHASSKEAKAVLKQMKEGKELPIFALMKERPSFANWTSIFGKAVQINTKQGRYWIAFSKDKGQADLQYDQLVFLPSLAA